VSSHRSKTQREEHMKTEIRHTDDGEMLHRLVTGGWDYIKTKFSDGCSRGMGGWWLYRGDHGEALALLEPIRQEITLLVRNKIVI
jgi:hypothetical protein